jgi:ribosomal-protein-alanine N-acetyltransferase
VKIILETERLIHREILPEDISGMFEMDSDYEVHRYVGGKPATSREESKDMIVSIRKQYVENGVARWALVEKSSNDFVGWSGLKLMTETINNHTNFYDIGYRLMRRHWGKGYATESAIAVRDYAFKIMKLKEIIAMTDPDNHSSKKVLEKTGLKYIEVFNYDGTPNWREKGQLTTWYKMENPFS